MAGKPPRGLMHSARASGGWQYTEGEVTSHGDEATTKQLDIACEIYYTSERHINTSNELILLLCF